MKGLIWKLLSVFLLLCFLLSISVFNNIGYAREIIFKPTPTPIPIPPSDAPDIPKLTKLPTTDVDGSFTVSWKMGLGSQNLGAYYTVQQTFNANGGLVMDNYVTVGQTSNKSLLINVNSSGVYKYRVKACNDDPACSAYGYSSNIIVRPPTAPTISNIYNRTINEDSDTGNIAFTIGDAETSASSLTLSKSSSNSSLVPTNNIILGGSGANRTVRVTPAANKSGSAKIIIKVSDGSMTTSDTFVVTVKAVNDKPTITSDRVADFNEDTYRTIHLGDLRISDIDSNRFVLYVYTNSNYTVSGTTIRPSVNFNGNLSVKMRVKDSAGAYSPYYYASVRVKAVNDRPTISNISNRTINEDNNTGNVAFTIGDQETSSSALILSKASSNTTLVPSGNIIFGGNGVNRTVRVTPAANKSGRATITIIVSDGNLTKNDTFLLTVTSVNDSPTISHISNRTINEDSTTGAISFTISDQETSVGSLTLSKVSNNTSLIPNGNIVLGGNGANRTVSVTPLADKNGTATITLTVSDGVLTKTDTFVVTVNSVNDLPTANAGSDQIVNEQNTVTLSGSGTDPEGVISGYSWVQILGPKVRLSSRQIASPAFTAPIISAATFLSFELTVTDSDGSTATDSVSILVNNVNQLPTALANNGFDFYVGEGSTVNLIGTGADPDGSIVSYAWAQTAGTSVTLSNANSANSTFTAPEVTVDEVLVFQLTVTDNEGGQGVDSTNITVRNIVIPDTPDIPKYVTATSTGDQGLVNIGWSLSSDPENLNAIFTVERSIEGGYTPIDTLTGMRTTDTVINTGDYIYRVKACNEVPKCSVYGYSDSVRAVINLPPFIWQGQNHEINVYINETVSFQLSAIDEENNILTWSQSSAPTNGSVSGFGTGDSRSFTYTPDSGFIGSDSFDIVVSDGKLSDTITVNVQVTLVPVDQAPAPHVEPLPFPDLTSDAISAVTGEFRVDEGGQANYTISLLTPKGSGGASPSVSLNYNSGSGNGNLGIGWSLSASSAITRCRRTAEQDGIGNDGDVSLNYSDVFCLDGQRLVLINNEDYGMNGAEYRTAIDTQTRIISYGTQGNGPSYFEVWRKDGSKTTYGTADDSDAELVANDNGVVQNTVITWFGSQVIDSSVNGNPITYQYDIDANVGEVVLKRISYNPNINIEFNYVLRSDLVRGYSLGGKSKLSKKLNNIVVTDNSIELRTYTLNYEISPTSLMSMSVGGIGLSRIKSITESVGGVSLPDTEFTWNDTSYKSSNGSAIGRSNRMDGRPADINGDGKADNYYVFHSNSLNKNYFGFEFSNGTQYQSSGCQFREVDVALASEPARENWHIIDYNADGKSDLMFERDGTFKVLLIEDDNCFADSLIDTGIVIDQGYARQMVLGDFNADGLSDILDFSFPAPKIYFMERDVNGINPYKFSSTPSLVTFTHTSMSSLSRVLFMKEDSGRALTYNQMGDFNGDGKVDLIAHVAHCPGGWDFFTGSCLTGAVSKTIIYASDGDGHFTEYAAIETDTMPLGSNQILDTYRRQIVDLNSDGFADLLYRLNRDGRWRYRLNTGKEFLDAVLITQIEDGGPWDHDGGTDFDTRGGVSVEGKPLTTYDANADGYVDLGYVHNGIFRVVEWSPGEGYLSSYQTPYAATDNTMSFVPVDLDGDGGAELLESSISKYRFLKVTENAYLQNKIQLIDNGMGNLTDITYGGSLVTAALYAEDNDAPSLLLGNQSPMFDLNGAMSLVRHVSSTSPDYDNPNRKAGIQYQYFGAKIQAGGRGFLGFRQLRTYDEQSLIFTQTSYRQDYPFVGMPSETTRFKFNTTLSGDILSTSSNNYLSKTTYNGSVVFPYLSQSTEEFWDFDDPSIKLKKEVVTYGDHSGGSVINDFDAYGNPLEITTSTYDASDLSVASKTVVNSYDNLIDSSKWHLSRLTNSVVTHRVTGKADVIRRSDFEYDLVTGLLEKEIIEKAQGANKELTTVYQHDNYGNITSTATCSVHVSDCGITTAQDLTNSLYINRFSYSDYDTDGRYVDQTRNIYGQVASEVNSRNKFGQPTSVTGLNGVVTESVYSSFGGAYFSRSSTGTWGIVTKALCDGSISCPAGAIVRIKSQSNGEGYSYQYVDAIGRDLKTSTLAFDNSNFYSVDFHYDIEGRNYQVSEPYVDSGSVTGTYFTVTEFDVIGRPIKINNPDLTYSQIDYQGLTTVYTNELQQTRVETKNAIGQIITLVDNLTGSLSYEYDANGNLEVLKLNNLTQSIMLYDNLGRKTSMKDWDKGGQNNASWTYDYNAAGELVSQTDAKGQISTPLRDELGRTINTYLYASNGSLIESTVRNFDNNMGTGYSSGNLLSESFVTTSNTSSHQKTYAYDAFGRGNSVTTDIDGLSYVQQTTFDQFGRVFQSFDASGGNKGLRNLYNSAGYLYKVREAAGAAYGQVYNEILTMDARGNVTSSLSGNGLVTSRSYTADRGFLDIITTGNANGTNLVQYIDHHFNALGHLEHKENLITNKVEDYQYDDLNRLDEISFDGGTYQNEVDYDAWGNITWKKGVGSYTYATKESGCGVTAGRHAVTAAGGQSYCYDQNGNQTSGNGRTITYSAFDKAVEIVKGGHTSKFEYDVNHRRFKRTDNAGGALTTTLYLGSVEIISSDTGTEVRRNLGGTIVSLKDGVSTTRYVYTDHIGSTDVITDAAGSVEQRFTFDAWGKKTSGEAISPIGGALTLRGFTGHESVEEVGIIHMNGRIYDPMLGRFLQADPIIQAPKNSQSLNRYSYVINNPLSLTDPSGFSFSASKWWRKNKGAVKQVASVVLSVVGGPLGVIVGGALVGGPKGAGIALVTMGAFSAIGSYYEGVAAANTKRSIDFMKSIDITDEFTLQAFASRGLTSAQQFAKVLTHAVAGGVLNKLAGGKFGNAFVAAGVTQAFAPAIDGIKSSPSARVMVASIVGGTASSLTGGKFANGAATSAFQWAFSEGARSGQNDGTVSTGEGSSTDANRAAFQKKLVALSTDGTLSSARTFGSIDAAAKEVLNATAPLSKKYGLEVAGSIWKDTDGYRYTFPIIGGEGSASLTTAYVGYHTHPSGRLRFSNQIYSYSGGSGDAGWVSSSGKSLYLGVQTSNGVSIGVCNPGSCSTIEFQGTKPSRVIQ